MHKFDPRILTSDGNVKEHSFEAKHQQRTLDPGTSKATHTGLPDAGKCVGAIVNDSGVEMICRVVEVWAMRSGIKLLVPCSLIG